jgi:hypothetical protein
MTMGQHGCSGAQEVIVMAQRERERRRRRSSGFLPMAPLGGGATEMATRRHSIEAVRGAPIGRWFWVRGREIGSGVGVMDNGGALVAPFIGS